MIYGRNVLTYYDYPHLTGHGEIDVQEGWSTGLLVFHTRFAWYMSLRLSSFTYLCVLYNLEEEEAHHADPPERSAYYAVFC